MRVPWFPVHLYPDPVISMIYWVGCPPSLGLSSYSSNGFGSTGLWSCTTCMGETVLVAIVTEQLGVSVGGGVSIHWSVAFSPKKLARSMGSVGASPKSEARLNWTCFCTGSKGAGSAGRSPKTWLWEWGTPMPLQLTPTNSALVLGMGILTPWSGLPCWWVPPSATWPSLLL